jgi:hypothetical protein
VVQRASEGIVMFVDGTPENIKQYWLDQTPEYVEAISDPVYQQEQTLRIALRLPDENVKWREKLEALDPAHPKASVPDWVRWAKRKKQDFRCFILGWHENDWMLNKQSGEIQQVGILTLDHTLAAHHGGLTTDANTKMIAEIANLKKGCKLKTYDEMRQFLHTIYELYIPDPVELIAIESMRMKNIKKVKL